MLGRPLTCGSNDLKQRNPKEFAFDDGKSRCSYGILQAADPYQPEAETQQPNLPCLSFKLSVFYPSGSSKTIWSVCLAPPTSLFSFQPSDACFYRCEVNKESYLGCHQATDLMVMDEQRMLTPRLPFDGTGSPKSKPKVVGSPSFAVVACHTGGYIRGT